MRPLKRVRQSFGKWSSFGCLTILNKNIKWSDFLDYNYTNMNCWVSATKIKNYLLNDTLVDYLDLYVAKRRRRSSSIDSYVSETETESYLKSPMTLGLEFEEKIYKELKQKYKNNVVQLFDDYDELKQNKVSLDITFKHMVKGTPIICQAPVYNLSNQTFGVIDLLVRSDWMNKIFKNMEIENTKADNLTGDYHYCVIDIKYSVLKLCSNGKNIRNHDRIPAYKGQLTIYNGAIGKLQGYFPSKSYILAKRYLFGENDIEDPYDRLGEIDYDEFDKDMIEKTEKGIDWIRRLRLEGSQWTHDPPSIPELYPNMNVSYNSKWTNLKKSLSKKNKELTMISGVSYKHRQTAHNNKLMSYHDKDFSSEHLGIRSEEHKELVETIVKIENGEDKISPKQIRKNTDGWASKYRTRFYIDFETLNGNFVPDDLREKGIRDFVYMIGIGHKVDGNYHQETFISKYLDLESERKMFMDAEKYISGIRGTKAFYHWSHAEKTSVRKVNERHNTEFMNYKFIDLLRVFKKEPIIIKDSMGFSLKNIARSMKKHGMIETEWGDELSDGYSSMKYARDAFKERDWQIMQQIYDYNEVDCKVLYEIFSYIFNNYKEKN